MPGSQSLIGGGEVPGLALRAWALVNGSNYSVIKGMNVASVTRPSVGRFNFTFSSALSDTNVLPIIRSEAAPSNFNTFTAGITSLSASMIQIRTQAQGVDVDPPGVFWVGFYG